jgi:hypothetical protein
VLALGLPLLSSLYGCGAPARPTLTDQQLHERAVADAAETAASFEHAVTKVIGRIEREMAEPGNQSPVINILAMSGGGDYGAFGAGFLVGWGQAADPAWKRPDFDVVTGVSTGALLAPFAYIGTDESCQQVEAFYRDPKPDWIAERGPLFFLPSNPSFATIPGLDRDVREAVNKERIAQLAEQSRQGKVLGVSATDIDLGRQKFWDVGAESEAAVVSGDTRRIEDMLLSSAAIPAIFPPIAQGDSLYVDGGVTANVFLRLDVRNPHAVLPRWRQAYPGTPLPKVRYWVIINNQLTHRPKTVQPKWPAVVGPALETSIRFATIAEVRWLTAEADYVNCAHGTDVEVRVVAIPDDWKAPVEGSFKQESMVSLADLGRKMGADPASWKLWTLPKPAPR